MIGGGVELRSRSFRDHYTEEESDRLELVKLHEWHLTICLQNLGHSDYGPSEHRRWVISPAYYPLLRKPTSWAEEAEWHREMIRQMGKSAAECAESKRFWQRRMLFP